MIFCVCKFVWLDRLISFENAMWHEAHWNCFAAWTSMCLRNFDFFVVIWLQSVQLILEGARAGMGAGEAKVAAGKALVEVDNKNIDFGIRVVWCRSTCWSNKNWYRKMVWQIGQLWIAVFAIELLEDDLFSILGKGLLYGLIVRFFRWEEIKFLLHFSWTLVICTENTSWRLNARRFPTAVVDICSSSQSLSIASDKERVFSLARSFFSVTGSKAKASDDGAGLGKLTSARWWRLLVPTTPTAGASSVRRGERERERELNMEGADVRGDSKCRVW